MSSAPQLTPLSPPDANGQREKNFGLSPAEFTEMVVALRAGDERLFEQIYLAQFNFCQGKLRQFDGLSEREAYDATMDALLHFRQLLLQDRVKYGNLRYLFVRIARQLYSRGNQKQVKVRELTAVELNTLPEVSDYQLTEDQYQQMNRAFSQMGKACRDLLKNVFFNHRSLQDIAADEGIAYATLRKQKSRCLQRLRNTLTSTY